MTKPIDYDLAWAIQQVEDNYDTCAATWGRKSHACKEAQRIEAAFKRLLKEAGYGDLSRDQTAQVVTLSLGE